jgi:hypothetical protein
MQTMQRIPMPTRHFALSALLAAVLAGCGGGGGGGDAGVASAAASGATPDTIAPSVTSAAPLPSAPADVPAPAPAPAAAGVSLADYGGVCDGRTDNSAAISRGIADTKSKGVALLIPSGQCNFGAVIKLDSAKISGNGASSVLYATNYQQASIFMYGSGASVTNVKLTGADAPGRQAAWESTKITVMGATDFVIDGVTIDKAPAASIQTAKNASRGTITNNHISNSLADSIHMTDGANGMTVTGNVIENSGDDGIAVVSYGYDGNYVSNVTARNNIVRGNRWGRNMSIVGGKNVVYENNLLENNPQYACMYVAQEAGYNSKGVDTVTLQRNTMNNCGSTSTSHGGVLVYSDGGAAVNNVAVLANAINQQGQNGIRAYGSMVTGLRVEGNQITGANPATTISTPGTVVVPYSGGPVGYVAP